MSDKGRILIVDDELSVRDSLARWFRDEGYEVGTAEDASDALRRMAETKWNLALVDIKMRGTDGIELQKRMSEIDRELIVIIMTGYASVETAVAALKNGAYDYVTKPLDPDDIAHSVKNALSHRKAEKQVERMQETLAVSLHPADIVGRSGAMRKVLDAIDTVGPTDATVLIVGESGTGKELVAKAIHAASPRRFQPLVTIHCGALTETLLESELFGHEKGAFTGAQYRKKGKFELAEGGTVFLDEIADISLRTQTDLLRVLQEHEITRVGGQHSIKVDFRCVAASNKDLKKLIEEGHFRPDLYYRLNVFTIDLPPLRERRDDIPLLVEHFVQKFAMQMNKKITRIAPEAMQLVQEHDWPGNIRELENAVERAMVVAREPEVREGDFSIPRNGGGEEQLVVAGGKSLQDVEKDYILKVMEECDGNQTRAARVLHIDRVTLHNKLKNYGWTRNNRES
ncbi:MAG: sigma-54 dependent transcriptional regulator [Thermoanaerobaculia bacterium]